MGMLHSHEEQFSSWEMSTASIAAGENTSSQSSKMKQSKNSISILPIEDTQRARKSQLSTQSAVRGLCVGEGWYSLFFAFPSSMPKDIFINTQLVFTCSPNKWQPKLSFIGAKHNKILDFLKNKCQRLLLFANVLSTFCYLPPSLFQKSITVAHVAVWPCSSNTDRTSHQVQSGTAAVVGGASAPAYLTHRLLCIQRAERQKRTNATQKCNTRVWEF